MPNHLMYREKVKMTRENQKNRKETMGRKWLKRLWGLLPVLVLVAIIIGLSSLIQTKSDRLDAARTGLQSLEGMQAAVAEIGRVAEIVKASEDQNQAVRALSAELGMTGDQAKAVLAMPLSALVAFERERLAGRIAYVERQIAAGKLDLPPEVPDVNVVALALAPVVLSDRISLPGVVAPWVRFDVAAEVRGQVLEKRVEKGDRVAEGDIIAVIDARDYEIAVSAARASYDAAVLSRNRVAALHRQQLAPKSQLDDITAQVDRFKAELDSAELNLLRCTIRSPINGIINDVYIDRGQYLNFADPVAGVMQMDRVKVSVGIPESDVSAVRAVADFKVTIDALGGAVYAGRKHFLARSADPMARLYALELEIDNPEETILPDMFARVEIVKQQVADALAVPLYAIIPVDGSRTVYVVSDGLAEAVSIETGIQEGWMIQATEGLSPGDRVIVVGHRQVGDGQRVNVVRTVTDMTDL